MKRFCSTLNQILQVIPRAEFEAAVRETQAERHARGYRCWDQFVAMIFGHLAGADSLREICGGLASCGGGLAQLGTKKTAKSTLAYANRHRDWRLYEKVFYSLQRSCTSHLGLKTKFRFKNPLLSLDSTHIQMCSELFPWASYSRQKGGLKLHFTLNHAGYLPAALVITTGKTSELFVARRQRFQAGTILLFDRGYIDFKWFRQLDDQGVDFITRRKANTAYEVLKSERFENGTDERIRFTGAASQKKYPKSLRLVTLHKDNGECFQFLTNNTTLSAQTIAAVYQDRWQIENFFRFLKQNLQIKSFLGTSANAVWTQIWTALIAMLLVRYLQLKSKLKWAFSNFVYFLRMNLLVYRDLWEWLRHPFVPPDHLLPQPIPVQGGFSWN